MVCGPRWVLGAVCGVLCAVCGVLRAEMERLQAGALPELPANARYVWHENKCFDWGTFGWAFESGEVVPAGYKYYIFLNSSVRGPFLPPYLQVSPSPAPQRMLHRKE